MVRVTNLRGKAMNNCGGEVVHRYIIIVFLVLKDLKAVSHSC